MQRHGTVNADGFGVGWYAAGDPVPARYRRGTPIWGDESLPDIARVTRSAAVLAAVRSATPGTASGDQAAAPLAAGCWLFSHNGVLEGWPGSARLLPVPADALASMEAVTDSALLWALVLIRLRAGLAPGAALTATIGAAEAAGATGRFNFLLTDGTSIAATACGDTLWYRVVPAGAAILDGGTAPAAGPVLADDSADGSVTVASEPADDAPGWAQVPDRHVLTAVPGRVDIRPIASATCAQPSHSEPMTSERTSTR
jgi:glutamine amidotransferase